MATSSWCDYFAVKYKFMPFAKVENVEGLLDHAEC